MEPAISDSCDLCVLVGTELRCVPVALVEVDCAEETAVTESGFTESASSLSLSTAS